MSLRSLAFVACLMLGGALTGMPVYAVEPPPGSKNFSPPGSVPNYFSNESGPFRGGAQAPSVQPGAAPLFAAPAPRGRTPVVASRRYGRRGVAHAARGRHRPAAVRGKMAVRGHATHGNGSARNKAVTAGSHAAPAKGRRIARAHS